MKNDEIHVHFHFSKKGLLRALRIGLIAAALATPVVLFAGTVVRPVPFDARAGDPIIAAEVNAIHNAIADAVDDNAADIAANSCTITKGDGFAIIDCGSGGSTRCMMESRRRVFVSSTIHSGDLGGTAGGDAICQQLADAASLAGTWRAWLSDNTQTAVDAVAEAEYTLVDGTTVIALNKADLIDGTIANEINMQEDGSLVTNYPQVWTGAWWDGTPTPWHCDDWTSSLPGDQGHLGLSSATNDSWSGVGGYGPCNLDNRLYCFEQ